MEAGARALRLVDELIALFNKKSDDLPDQLFDRGTQFVLNNVPYEEMLGRSPTDPLILMLTRGPAGYRLAAKAMRHAVPDALIERGDIVSVNEGGRQLLRWQCWLSGHLRGTSEPIDAMFEAEFAFSASGRVERAAVGIDDARLAKIRAARMRA